MAGISIVSFLCNNLHGFSYPYSNMVQFLANLGQPGSNKQKVKGGQVAIDKRQPARPQKKNIEISKSQPKNTSTEM